MTDAVGTALTTTEKKEFELHALRSQHARTLVSLALLEFLAFIVAITYQSVATERHASLPWILVIAAVGSVALVVVITKHKQALADVESRYPTI